MNPAESDAPQLFGYDVVTGDGNKVGSVDGVWVDDATDQPEFIGVKTGMIFGKNHLMPIEQAQVDTASQSITVPYSEDQIKDGPSFGTDDTLSANDEQQIYSYYRLRRSTATSPTGYGGAGTTETITPLEATGSINRGTTLGPTDLSPSPMEVDLTTSEEELVVGKRVVQAGQVRLRKVVRTVHQEVPVELRHEEVRIERLSPGEASGLGVPADAFQEKEIDVSVMREQPVVAMEAHVTGGIRLTKDVETETRIVAGDVRRSEVEVEGSDLVDSSDIGNRP